MSKEASLKVESEELELDPSLQAVKTLSQPPINPGHPLGDTQVRKVVPMMARSDVATVKQAAKRVASSNGSNKEKNKSRSKKTRQSHYRKRWPKSLDVRHNKEGHKHLRDLWEPLQENRLDSHGRSGCEEMSHMDLARAFIDYCRGQIKLPKDAAPKSYSELLELVKASIGSGI